MLEYDEPLSDFAFDFNLRRYTMAMGGTAGAAAAAGRRRLLVDPTAVGRCNLIPIQIRVESAWLQR